MPHRYEIVTYSRDIGSDERGDFSRKADAIRYARSFRKSEDYTAVYDALTRTATVIFGSIETPVFSENVTVRPLRQNA